MVSDLKEHFKLDFKYLCEKWKTLIECVPDNIETIYKFTTFKKNTKNNKKSMNRNKKCSVSKCITTSTTKVEVEVEVVDDNYFNKLFTL